MPRRDAGGLVTTICVDDRDRTLFKLDYEGAKPKDGWFLLEKRHTNYANLFALISMAAIHRIPLHARCYENISPTRYGRLAYAEVGF